MSTSLLYHGFAVRGYQYVSTDYVGGEIWFGIEQPRRSCVVRSVTRRRSAVAARRGGPLHAADRQ